MVSKLSLQSRILLVPTSDMIMIAYFSVAKRDRWCQHVPKKTGEAGYRSLNPMGEFLDEEAYKAFESKFQKFRRTFQKNYDGEEEYRKRLHIARHNIRYTKIQKILYQRAEIYVSYGLCTLSRYLDI